jgi:flagellar export protein FliJ
MSKTEFSELIKIEKNKLQNLERELQRELARVSNFQHEISTIEGEILEIEYPISGTFSMLQQYNIAMHNMKSEAKKREIGITEAQRRIEHIRQDMIGVEREIEKFQFLEEEILKERRAEEKRRESKELDEMAVMLYKRSRS